VRGARFALVLLLTGCAAPDVQEAPLPGVPARAEAVVVPRLQAVQLAGETYGDGAGTEAPSAVFGPTELAVDKDITRTTRATRSAALVFAVPDVAPHCLEEARLEVTTSSVDGEGPLRAYPGAALSLARGELPPSGDAPTTLLDTRPAGLETVRPDGTRSYEVTELVRRWTSGAGFPSRGRAVPAGSPLVLVLRTPDLAEGRYGVVVPVTADSPRLEVRPRAGCT
jgi:hypothetical protein